MRLKKLFLGLICCSASVHLLASPTEFDQYLINKQILNNDFKIKNTQALNEILDVISVEDSRTLPFQVDQNMLMEQYNLRADHVEIQGIITTPDFAQFEQSIGVKEVKQLIKKNTLQSCHLLFEHEFQRKNPYAVKLVLASEKETYQLTIPNTECKF